MYGILSYKKPRARRHRKARPDFVMYEASPDQGDKKELNQRMPDYFL